MGRRANLIILGSAAALILFSLSAIVYALWPFLVAGRVQGDIDALRAQGKPVSLEDLQPRKIPDSQNAAVVFDRVFEHMQGPESWRDLDTLGSFVEKDGARQDPANWAAARAALSRYADVLATAEEAVKRPRCQFPLRRMGSGGGPGRYSPTRRIRTVARLLAAKATISAKDGDTRTAEQALDLTIRCGELLRSQPSLGSTFSRISVLRTYSRAIRNVAMYARLDEQIGRRLYDELGRVDLDAEFTKALEGERAIAISMFTEWQTKGTRAFDEVANDPKTEVPRSVRIPGNLAIKTVLKVDERVYLKQMAKEIRRSRLPYRTVHPIYVSNRDAQERPKYAIFTNYLLPDFDRLWAARDTGTTYITQARVALALEAYRNRFGSYPDSLAQVQSRLGWKLDSDPFSGKDFRYHRDGSGYMLYSVGPNLQDDGGAQIEDARDRFESVPTGAVDIVWEMHRPV